LETNLFAIKRGWFGIDGLVLSALTLSTLKPRSEKVSSHQIIFFSILGESYPSFGIESISKKLFQLF
jgi:hypothetical protein